MNSQRKKVWTIGCASDIQKPVEKSKDPSESRSIWPQVFTNLIVNVVKFCFGLFVGFSSIMIAKLSKDEIEIKATMEEITWFSSNLFMSPIAGVIGGYFSQYLGSKIVIIIASFLFTICSILFNQTINSTMILCTQALLGFTQSFIVIPCFSYIAEITEARYRGSFMALINFSQAFGLLVALILGHTLYWRTMYLVCLPFSTFGAVAMFFLPESPYWLLSKNRYQEAEKSLMWFRGYSDNENIKNELQSILEKSDIGNKLPKIGEINVIDKRTHLKKFLEPYKKRTFILPLLTICYMFFIVDLAGSAVLLTFSIVLFGELHSPIQEITASTISVAIRLLSSLTCILTIRILGKRRVSLISMSCTCIACIIVSIFGFLIDYNIVGLYIFAWIPTIFLIITIFVSSAGVNKVVYLMNSELFPSRLRHVGAGIGHFFSQIIATVMNKIFLYLNAIISTPGIFAFFAVVYMIGIISFYFILPETENKSLEDIERYYARVGKSKRIKSDQERCDGE